MRNTARALLAAFEYAVAFQNMSKEHNQCLRLLHPTSLLTMPEQLRFRGPDDCVPVIRVRKQRKWNLLT